MGNWIYINSMLDVFVLEEMMLGSGLSANKLIGVAVIRANGCVYMMWCM